MREDKQGAPQIESVAKELLALMIVQCEECHSRLGGASKKQKAMASCAIAVREEIKSFLSVLSLPD